MSGHTQLRKMLDRLASMGSVAADSARDVSVAVRRELEEQIERAEGPDGRRWPRTRDGRRALRNAKRALSVKAVGNVVIARLTGHHARHNVGAVKGGVRRQILPSGGLPDAFTRAIARVIERRFREIASGDA